MEQLPKVLLSSDSVSSGLLWQFRLRAKNITILIEPNLGKVMERALSETPDLVVLDFSVLDEESIPLIYQLREQQANPLIVLISPWDANAAIKVYEAGVDDCIIKPMEVNLFTAKVNAWLRRRMVMPAEMLNPVRVGKLHLDPCEKVLNLDNGLIIHLTNIEVRLLYVLMSRAGRTIQTDELISLVWRNKEDVCRAILKNMIYRLRQKLETDPARLRCIHTVTGFGYKFEVLADKGDY